MKINSLEIQNYRNIENIKIEPCEGVNIIYGENAQGKTNLLEAIWLFTGCKSFRGNKEKELIKFDKDFSTLEMNFFDDERDRDAIIKISDKKRLILSGIEYDSCSKLFGEFFGILFAPNNLNLIKGGPVERRKFINMALCQLRPKYANILSEYNKVLFQRNSLLKDLTYHSELYDTLDIWDEKLAYLSSLITLQRIKYLQETDPFIKEIYKGISSDREKIEIIYDSALKFESQTTDELKEEFLKALISNRKEDILSGSTSIGPHRDDILVKLDGIPVKNFGSQGQQRSCALALKLSEAAVIKKITGKQPIALLDDVMSELDTNRQDYILNHIDGWQVFITCCEPSSVLKAANGKIFEIKEGSLCSCT